MSDNKVFRRKDLIECLSIFDADDRVFFLISDCETKGQVDKSLEDYAKFEKAERKDQSGSFVSRF